MKIREMLTAPSVGRGVLRVWRRDFLFYRKTWIVNLLWTILEPLMYLAAIGYGLGAYVSNMSGQSYVEFLFPGILCTTAMTVAFFESTYGNFTKLTWQKTYSTIMMTRISPEEVVVGELLWCASKGVFGAIGVALVASFLGLVDSWKILPALGILVAVAWLFSCLGMIVTSIVRNYDQFIFFISGFIIPMSLVAGVYFPVDQLPPGLKQLVWLLPLPHAVSAVRLTLTGTDWLWVGVHVSILVLAGWIAMKIAVHRIRERLLR